MGEPSTTIRTILRESCPVCAQAGGMLYSGLKDFTYSAPGEWSFRKCADSACGTVWLDPAPAPEDLGKAYESYYTHDQPEPGPSVLRTACWAIWNSYLGGRFGYQQGVGPSWLRPFSSLALLHPGGRDELDAAAMHLSAPAPGGRVLDVGCGSGVLLQRMNSLGWQAEGVEIDPGGVRAARRRGVTVHEGTLQDQKFAESSFDAVHSAHVLEHLYEPAGLLAECRRILKPEGRLVLLTPNIDCLGREKFGAAWLALDPPRHLTLFTPAGLRKAAEKAGFRSVRVETTVRIAWVLGALSLCIRRTGRGEMSQLGNPMSLLRGFAWQYRERIAKTRNPDAGGELKLTAIR